VSPLHLALVHHPVVDKTGEVVTTAVTNLDVHDLCRSAKTYGFEAYHLVTPITAQRALVDQIRAHWVEGAGKKRVPARAEALALLRPCGTLEEAIERITEERDAPYVVATSARPPDGTAILDFDAARAEIRTREAPTLLVFGTGHGLAPAVYERADAVLAPIRGGRYNHLSVRAAVAIILDRLVGEDR